MNEKQINNFLEEFEEQNLQKKWTDIIILPFDDKWKDKEQEILTLTRSDIVEQLSSFFQDRFLIDIDLSSKFDKTISDILSEDFFFLDYRDIQYNLSYLFKLYYLTKEEREKNEKTEEILSSISKQTRNFLSDKGKSWRKMSLVLQTEFKDIKFKNKKLKIKFSGLELPTACDDGFQERMSFKNIKYWIDEQGSTIEEVIFCTTAVYIMSIIEIKQAILFKQYGEELLKEISKDTLLNFLLNLNNLKNVNKLF